MRNNMTYSEDKIGKKYFYFSRALKMVLIFN